MNVNYVIVFSDATTVTGQDETFAGAKRRVESLAVDPFYTRHGARRPTYVAFGRDSFVDTKIVYDADGAGRLEEVAVAAVFEAYTVSEYFPRYTPSGYGLLAQVEAALAQ